MVPIARGTRITGEEREQLMLSCVRRYRAGESIRSLAADTGRSYGFIQGLLKEAGVPLRPRGGATRGAEAEADRAERQARVEAVRAAERVGTEPAGAPEPERAGTGPARPDRDPDQDQDRDRGGQEAADDQASDEESGPRDLDLDRVPTSPADLGLPTPPLGVLVKKKSKRRSKAKKIAAEKAKEGNGPRILAVLEADAADGSDPSDRTTKGGSGKKKKDKSRKKGKDKSKGAAKKPKKSKK